MAAALYVAREVSKQSLTVRRCYSHHISPVLDYPPSSFPRFLLCHSNPLRAINLLRGLRRSSSLAAVSIFQSSLLLSEFLLSPLHSCPSFLSRCLLRCLPPLLFLCVPAVAPPPPCWPTALDKVSLTLSTFPKYTRSKSRCLTVKHKPSCEHDDVTDSISISSTSVK